MKNFLLDIVPYLVAFGGALALTLVLTPVVRELNRKLGMVDKPDPRRINKVPIPRGGGIAVVLGVIVSYSVFIAVTGRPAFQGFGDVSYLKMITLSALIALLGLADDRYGLPPKVKLLGQVAVAVGAWWWAGLSLCRLWSGLPVWLDAPLTVFWIVGAINAFNLIDGLDGLATGLALIATLGMAGSLMLVQNPQATLFYFAFAGGLLGFLRYNYNPASVFLGDSGSMFIGFVLSTLPLASQAPNSFLVSVGVPLLAMGVPIFDTALAILRRSIRHVIKCRETRRGEASGGVGNDKVMTADTDHLHHRILRAAGLNQRKAAWTLYLISLLLVLTGLCGISFKSKAAGLWLLAVAAASVIIFRNLARIEFFDAGQLLNSVAHNTDTSSRRRWARLAVPFYLVFDVGMLVVSFLIVAWLARLRLNVTFMRVALPIRVTAMFACLCFFNTYRTVWSRAMVSNYVRLFLACAFGSVAGTVGLLLAPQAPELRYLRYTAVAYPLIAFVLLVTVRIARGIVRDFFYAIDCARLKQRKDVSRILVYGAGLRYRSFRRELVRTTAANDRMIVGLLDDDILLRDHYIGGIRVMGTINQAPEIINEVNADAVVIACEVTDEWLAVVKRILAPTGVKVTHFGFTEKEV